MTTWSAATDFLVERGENCALFKTWLYMLYKATLFMEFCPDIFIVKPQLLHHVLSILKGFISFHRIKSVGANERAAIKYCALLQSWQMEDEKCGLFALFLLPIIRNCTELLQCCTCPVSDKIIYFHNGGQSKVGRSLLLLVSY